MMATLWLRRIVRRPARLVGIASGVALAVALLAVLGGFLGEAKSTMTKRAVASVAIDWQVQVAAPATSASAVAKAVRTAPSVSSTRPVEFAHNSGFSAETGSTTQTTGAGYTLGVPPDYQEVFPEAIRPLVGTARGVLVTQQTAANLRVRPGMVISIDRAPLPSLPVQVDGIVELPQADSLFQVVGAPPGAQRQAPPDNVVLLPSPIWHRIFDPLRAVRPDLVATQIHARLDHHLPADPSAAFTAVSNAARNLDARLAGGGTVGDNLAATLDAARSDSLYAQSLFLFLGLPGAVLAGLLSASFAASGAARRRRESALLRVRGATTRMLMTFACTEAAVVGIGGGVAGLALAMLTSRWVFHHWYLGTSWRQGALWSVGALAVGVVVAMLTLVIPARRQAREMTIASGRKAVGSAPDPRWRRYGVDFMLLGAGVVAFWLTARNGYQLVIAPEGVPTISVTYWALAAPACIWLGAGLLMWRVVDASLRRGGPVLAAVTTPFAGGLGGTVAAALRRQRRLLAASATVVGLAVAFGLSTAAFNATYQAQAGIDAVLTNGSDVTVRNTSGIDPRTVARIATLPGVHHAEPLLHRYAYVGSDLQDLYGVHATTIVDAARLQDAYVAGASVQDTYARLARDPRAILVSAETARDYQLRLGDRLTLRLADARTGRLTPVRFRYAGIATEFPTAPRDSFLVANAGFVARAMGSAAADTVLVDTGGTGSTTVSHRARTLLGTRATVTDLATARQVVGSSLTAVDLHDLSRIELVFALGLAVAAGGVSLWLGFEERRRANAIATALGATPRQIGAFLVTEVGVITGAGIALGAVLGWAQARVLVKVLSGVFDPPPASMTIPWAYVLALLMSVCAAGAVAAIAGTRGSRRDPLEVLRTS
jgi:putative ABC transport system permease protein